MLLSGFKAEVSRKEIVVSEAETARAVSGFGCAKERWRAQSAVKAGKVFS
jgi:hypothetical protein